MKFSVENKNDSKLIILDVEKFDVSNMQEIKKGIVTEVEENPNNTTLDFSNVDFVDSSGLSVVISLFKQLKSLDLELTLSGLKEQPMELIEITQLHKIFKIVDGCNVA